MNQEESPVGMLLVCSYLPRAHKLSSCLCSMLMSQGNLVCDVALELLLRALEQKVENPGELHMNPGVR